MTSWRRCSRRAPARTSATAATKPWCGCCSTAALRVSELCGLVTKGVDLNGGKALVKGKGTKVRPVYFGVRTARAVDRYLRARSIHRWSHLDALFLAQRGP
jgi:site-specific recombinase XerC